ncbi:MAG: type II secretion system F family protein [Proteobacteria bacterium]|nr:type II secretion system F family protein [Pseudomonadota bacterium]
MPRFEYLARTHAGEALRGTLNAADEYELDRRLAAEELLLVESSPRPAARAGSVAARSIIDFCYHLSVVIESGIPLLQGLRDLAEQNPGVLGDTIADIAEAVEGGSALSDALGEHPEVFSELIRSLVRAGEQSGALDRVLADLVQYLEWRESLGRKLRTALAYPAVVVAGVFGLILVVSTYVLPNFLGIFSELGIELPATTRALVATHQFVLAHGVALMATALAVLVVGVVFLRTEAGRLSFDQACLRLPVLGTLVEMIEASRFSHNLGLLYAAGLTIPHSLEMLEGILQNRVLRGAVASARDGIDRGESLADAIGSSNLMPAIVNRMVAIGEESGRLDQALERVSSFYDREVPALIDRALLLFNTGTVLFLGIVLLLIVLAVFVPLYSMLGNLDAAA